MFESQRRNSIKYSSERKWRHPRISKGREKNALKNLCFCAFEKEFLSWKLRSFLPWQTMRVICFPKHSNVSRDNVNLIDFAFSWLSVVLLMNFPSCCLLVSQSIKYYYNLFFFENNIVVTEYQYSNNIVAIRCWCNNISAKRWCNNIVNKY